MKSSDIHIRTISHEMPQPSITKICLKITYLKFHSNFPGANVLICSQHCGYWWPRAEATVLSTHPCHFNCLWGEHNFVMMTSSIGNIFRVTGHLYGEFTGERGIQRSPVNSPHKDHWHGALMFPLICAWINGWVNNGEPGDLRRHRAHYDVIAVDIIDLNL